MYNFTYHVPTKVLFGGEYRKSLAGEMLSFGKRVLLVYGGRSLKASGLYGEITGELRAAGAELFELPGVTSNPLNTKADEGAAICRENGVDVILAAGGGSVIDCAKAVSVTAPTSSDCWSVITKRVAPVSAIPLVTLLTVAGTGSEMNCSCVISNAVKRAKRGFSCDLLYPKVSFLDPALTCSVPAFQTACGCADALSHVIDTAYFLPGDRMDLLAGVAEAVARTVVRYGPVALSEPGNLEARANLMWASSLALNGLLKNGIRSPAACHIMEHELSALYGINHGLGMAVLLPRWLRHMLCSDNAGIYAAFGRGVFGFAEGDDRACAEGTLAALENFLYGELGLPSTFEEAGVEVDTGLVTDKICGGGGSLVSLKRLMPRDIATILDMCRVPSRYERAYKLT